MCMLGESGWINRSPTPMHSARTRFHSDWKPQTAVYGVQSGLNAAHSYPRYLWPRSLSMPRFRITSLPPNTLYTGARISFSVCEHTISYSARSRCVQWGIYVPDGIPASSLRSIIWLPRNGRRCLDQNHSKFDAQNWQVSASLCPCLEHILSNVFWFHLGFSFHVNLTEPHGREVP